MAAPTNSPWAQTTLNNIPTETTGQGTVYYSNKLAPPTEIQVYGLLIKTPLALQHINYQFDNIWQNIEYLKAPEVEVLTNTTTSRTFTLPDRAKQIRFTNASNSSYTINEGVATVGTTIHVTQAAAGVVTLTGGSGVTFNVKAGFAAKTSGLNTNIFARKVSQGSGVESWDVWGDLGT